MESEIERIGERDVRGTKGKVITHGYHALATEQALVRQNSSVSGLRDKSAKGYPIKKVHFIQASWFALLTGG